jgi:large subunit ribosomal protein L7Ae
MPAKKEATTTTTNKPSGKKLSPKEKLKAVRLARKKNPLIEARRRVYGIGQRIAPKRDLSRFVRWPKYIRIQRQRRVLLNRFKVPPPINQFSRTLDKNAATQLLALLTKYRPETKAQKKERLKKAAEKLASEKEGKKEPQKTEKPVVVKYGLNHVTSLVEQKQAKLVAIAHDVDPIELVVWLPTLCRKMDVPYCIVKGKSRLGQVVHKKNATCLALTEVRKEDQNTLGDLSNLLKDTFNKNSDLRRVWGGGKLGGKSVALQRKRARIIAREEAAKKKH